MWDHPSWRCVFETLGLGLFFLLLLTLGVAPIGVVVGESYRDAVAVAASPVLVILGIVGVVVLFANPTALPGVLVTALSFVVLTALAVAPCWGLRLLYKNMPSGKAEAPDDEAPGEP